MTQGQLTLDGAAAPPKPETPNRRTLTARPERLILLTARQSPDSLNHYWLHTESLAEVLRVARSIRRDHPSWIVEVGRLAGEFTGYEQDCLDRALGTPTP